MILEVNNISKAYGDHQVLKSVSFKISEPEVVALVGPNGSGKSTLLNIMVNLLDADQGRVTYDGIKNTNPAIFKRVSFLKDNTILYPYLSGWQHLSYAARIYGLRRSRVDQVINKMEIGHYIHRPTQSYSLGMKQTLLLSLGILNQPDLLLLDEPLTGLDPTAILKTRYLLKSMVDEGTLILMSSHTLAEIDAVTNHVLFLKDGVLTNEYLNEQSTEERYKEIYT